MPTGHDVSKDSDLLMPSFHSNTNDSYNADISAASILKSVKEQEAQFERLTRELEAERESVAHQLQKCKVASTTDSMSSITSTDESFHWRSPQPLQDSHLEDESADTKMSSHLLDSCLRELEDRGALNVGEDGNMEYLHEDPYASHRFAPQHSDQYHSPYGSGNYAANTSFDRHSEHSAHSSHLSLGSNRDARANPSRNIGSKVGTTNEAIPGSRGSVSSLQHQDQPNGNYMFSPAYPLDESRNSPMPQSASPLGPSTPTRFSSNPMPPYHNLPPYSGAVPSSPQAAQRFSVDSHENYPHEGFVEPYNNYGLRENDYPGGRNSYQAPSDHGGPPYGSQNYRDLPRYDDEQPYDRYHPHDDSNYRDSPLGHPYQDEPPLERQHGEPQYLPDLRPPYGDDYAGPPYYDDRPGENLPPDHDDPYGKYPNDVRYPDHPDDSFRGPGPEEVGPRGRSEIENPGYRQSYQDSPYDPYGDHPGDLSGDVDGPHYRGNYHHPDDPYREQEEPRFRGSYGDPVEDPYRREHPDDTGDPIRRYEGLPAVQADPFANDPFKDGLEKEGYNPRDEDPYYRGPSPTAGSDRYGPPGQYDDREPPYSGRSYDERDAPEPYNAGAPHYDDYLDQQPYPTREELHNTGAPPPEFSDGRRTPSNDGRRSFRWRNPDLQEVIDYLGHQDNDIKAHAAAYLQHLCFMDDDMKAKTRGLDGIRALVQLLNNEYPEVHRNACGALQNLSYGRTNDDNKRAIKNEGGIPELIRLLRKTQDEDVKESVTGILWNLSSCDDLKKPIIDDGLAVLVNVVIIPNSGWDRIGASPYREGEPWTTVFRNATGVLRNVSSAGFEARKKLRECRNLVNALIHRLKTATESNDIDNKPVENIVCILRNLSYRIQEVEDPDFYKKRAAPRQQGPDKGEASGCFGGAGGKKKGAQQKENTTTSVQPKLPPGSNEYKPLWGSELIRIYSTLLKTCSNHVTLEASAGAVQNLTACYWQPAVDIRALVRKEKGLPHLVDLLTFSSDRVICAAATALRNLAIDERNKELVGKYAMRQLVSKLPQDTRAAERPTPDDTLCAVVATLYEVVKTNQDFAQSLMMEDGLSRLMNITKSESRYLARTIKYAATVLKTMWQFKALHSEYAKLGLAEKDFTTCTATPRVDGQGGKPSSMSPATSNHTTPYNTLNRPISAQGYDDNTLSSRQLQNRADRPNNYGGYGSRDNMDGYFSMGHSNPALNDDMDHQNYYGGGRGRPEEIPLNDIGPGYAPIDEPRPQRSKPPVGGVPLFPNLPPGEPHDVSQSGIPEPLYAQVNKGNKQRRPDDMGPSDKMILNSSGGQGGADSWV